MNLNNRALLLISFSTACWAFSFGLGTQVLSHWLTARGVGDDVIGLAHSFYYFGLAVASCMVPTMSRWLGLKACATYGMIGAGVTLALFPWADAPWSWYGARFLNGCFGALSLVPLESIVNRESLLERKTVNFACYGVALTLGGALGVGIGMCVYQPTSAVPFYWGAVFPVIGGATIGIGLMDRPATAKLDVREPLGWTQNFPSYGTAWYQGFLEGGMLAFLTLFLVSRGFSEAAAGGLMGVTMAGVIFFQLPVSWVADRCGKTPTLLACYGGVAIGLAAIPWLANPILLAITLFAFGACTGAMYPLGLSMLGDRMPDSGLPRAYAWYLAIECVGSQIGAAAMGKARNDWGDTQMFAVGLVALALVILAWVVVRFVQSGSSNSDMPASEILNRRHAA